MHQIEQPPTTLYTLIHGYENCEQYLIKLEERELEKIFDEGESWRIERKESLSGSASKSVQEAICAFSNDLAASGKPGVVFIGVTDDGRAPGFVPNDERLR